MFQPARPREGAERAPSLLGACFSCLNALVQCMCCLEPEMNGGEGGQHLLSAHQESSSLGIEAAASPQRLPIGERGAPLKKGHDPSAHAGLQPAASPPMPPPFFPAPIRRHKRRTSDASRQSGSGSDGASSPEGASPKAGASGKGAKGGGHGGLSLLEDEDICPTCLDPYTEDNPKVLTRCNHHFHLPCLYEWLERSETCPVCSNPMQFEEIM